MTFVTMKGFNRQGWQPGANTIVYYPLDSTNTVNDLSGHNYHLTNVSNNILFGTYQGADCAKFSKSNYYNVLYRENDRILPTGAFTYNVFLYIISGWSYNPRMFVDISYPNGILLGSNGKLTVGNNGWNTGGISTSANARHMYTITGTFSSGAYTGYVDGVQTTTWTKASSTTTGILIGAGATTGGSSAADKYDGYMGKIILEDKIWTTTEIADYFNQTKSDYGIS